MTFLVIMDLKNTLSGLSTTDLLAYLDAQNKELFKAKVSAEAPVEPVDQDLDAQNKELFKAKVSAESPVEPVDQDLDAQSSVEPDGYSLLPWSMDGPFPEFAEIQCVLEKFNPKPASHRTVNSQVSLFYKLVERQIFGKDKAVIAYHLFRFLAANVWYLEQDLPSVNKLRSAIASKLTEFEGNPLATKIVKDFSWMKEYPYPEEKKNGQIPPLLSNEATSLGIFNILPWSTADPVPDRAEINMVMHKYFPVKVDNDCFTRQVKIFLKIISDLKHDKEMIAYQLFRLINANLWYCETHPEFRRVIRDKLVEFETSSKGGFIVTDFSWMKEYPYPVEKACHTCKCVGRWTDCDKDVYYCYDCYCSFDITQVMYEYLCEDNARELLQELLSEHRVCEVDNYELAKVCCDLLGKESKYTEIDGMYIISSM